MAPDSYFIGAWATESSLATPGRSQTNNTRPLKWAANQTAIYCSCPILMTRWANNFS
jgi:hypothetical protein